MGVLIDIITNSTAKVQQVNINVFHKRRSKLDGDLQPGAKIFETNYSVSVEKDVRNVS